MGRSGMVSSVRLRQNVPKLAQLVRCDHPQVRRLFRVPRQGQRMVRNDRMVPGRARRAPMDHNRDPLALLERTQEQACDAPNVPQDRRWP